MQGRDVEDRRTPSSDSDESDEDERERRRKRRARARQSQRRQTAAAETQPEPARPVVHEEKAPAVITQGLGLGGEAIDLIPKGPQSITLPDPDPEEVEEEEGRDEMTVYRDKSIPWISVNDTRVIQWSIFKCLVYVVAVSVVFFIIGNKYSKVPCVILEPVPFCLRVNRTTRCVPEVDEACRPACEIGTVGCLFGLNAEGGIVATTCLTETFETTCKETFSCPDEGAEKVLSALRYIGIFLVLQTLFELLFAVSLSTFRSLHPEEFGHLGTGDKVAAFMAKVLPQALQLLWWIQLLLWINLLYTYLSHASECSNARQDTDPTKKYGLFQHTATFTLFDIVWLVLSFGFGSYMRFRFPVRGQLYTPSDIDVKGFPLGLDCQSCRDDPELRCKTCFNRCCRPCGVWLEQCWKDKQKFGP